MRIDSHQHFWKPERGDYGWLTPELTALYRDFLPSDLRPLLDEHGIDRTILVQAAPTVAETRFLLELAHRHEWIAGVVGWVDFEATETPKVLRELSRDPHLVGIRPMVQDLEDDAWLSRPSHASTFEALVENDLVFDALVLPKHLSHTLTVVERHPDLSVVIDHAAKPTLRDGVGKQYYEEISNLAAFPSVSCKLSGLVTEAGPDWTAADLAPVVDHLLEKFGPERILWGSDWPVVTLACDYPTWWTTTTQLLSGLDPEQESAILGENAERIYLNRTKP